MPEAGEDPQDAEPDPPREAGWFTRAVEALVWFADVRQAVRTAWALLRQGWAAVVAVYLFLFEG